MGGRKGQPCVQMETLHRLENPLRHGLVLTRFHTFCMCSDEGGPALGLLCWGMYRAPEHTWEPSSHT